MIKEILLKYLIPSEAYVYGFAALQGLLDGKFPGFNFGISIGKKLDDRIIDNIKDGPTIEYYNHYKNINAELAELTGKITEELNEAGYESFAVRPTISSTDEDYNEEYIRTLTIDISHKMVATRAGMGWIGKSDLFISMEFGPRLRLVTILLKQDPGVDSIPVVESECGKCTICVVRCPAKALSGKLWNINVPREQFFNAHKCREKCNELARDILKVDARICGLCVAVCPIGRKARISLHSSS